MSERISCGKAVPGHSDFEKSDTAPPALSSVPSSAPPALSSVPSSAPPALSSVPSSAPPALSSAQAYTSGVASSTPASSTPTNQAPPSQLGPKLNSTEKAIAVTKKQLAALSVQLEHPVIPK